jgi:hypothetical protein
MYSGSFRDAKLKPEIFSGLMFSQRNRLAPSEGDSHAGQEREWGFMILDYFLPTAT